MAEIQMNFSRFFINKSKHTDFVERNRKYSICRADNNERGF